MNDTQLKQICADYTQIRKAIQKHVGSAYSEESNDRRMAEQISGQIISARIVTGEYRDG